MLGALDKPSAGSLYVDGKDLLKFDEKDLIKYKRETVGFVWQNNARNLIPYLTAIQNVEMPLLLSGHKNRRERAEELLDMVGLSARKNSVLGQLSGGEQQRVAIAIALSNNPSLHERISVFFLSISLDVRPSRIATTRSIDFDRFVSCVTIIMVTPV